MLTGYLEQLLHERRFPPLDGFTVSLFTPVGWTTVHPFCTHNLGLRLDDRWDRSLIGPGDSEWVAPMLGQQLAGDGRGMGCEDNRSSKT